jgi:hypothetical protein
MNALGAVEWNGEVCKPRDGPVGQLGNAQVIPLDDMDALRDEYESMGEEGEGQPIEIGDDVAEELGED